MQPRDYRWIQVAVALLVCIVLFYAPAGFATGDDLAVDGSYSCSGGVASGQLLASGASCPTTLKMDNLFSFMLCNFEQLAGDILGNMYCGFIDVLGPAVWYMATLAVIFFGISFMFGIIPATGRDAMMFLIKIAFVTAFATHADMVLNYGYKFLVGGIRDGVQIALNGMYVDDVDTGNDAFKMLDGFLFKLFQYATDSVDAATPDDRCKNAIFAVIATMAVAFPMLAYLALALVARTVLTFLRAALGYVYSIVGITFLLILSPIFISFFLFKVTRPFFDKWLGYLVSFCVQMVLLFAFLAFILSLKGTATNMMQSVSDIVMYQDQVAESSSFRWPWKYCTLCSFKVVNRDDTSIELTQSDADFITKGKMVCKIADVNTPLPVASYDPNKPTTDAAGRVPINLTFAIAPDSGSNELNSLIKLAGNGILSLLVLAMCINYVLGVLPALAMRLAGGLGATYAPTLGGGQNIYGGATMAMPGASLMRDFQTGFTQSMGRSASPVGTKLVNGRVVGAPGVTSPGQAYRDGLASMITGRGKNNATGKFDKDLYETTGGTPNPSDGVRSMARRFLFNERN